MMTSETAIALLNNLRAFSEDDDEPAIDMAIEVLSKTKTGKWIVEETDEYKRTYCSECGGSAPFECVSDDYYGRRFHGETRKTKFCPNCGAMMSGEMAEPKTGHVETASDGNPLTPMVWAVCSECKEPIDPWDKYCRSCGARMLGEEE